MSAPLTGTCRHCGATITRADIAAPWRDANMSGGCSKAYYHAPTKDGAR